MDEGRIREMKEKGREGGGKDKGGRKEEQKERGAERER